MKKIVILVGLLVGAVVGYLGGVPVYRSQGLLYVEPLVYSFDSSGGGITPMLSAFIDAQVVLMKDRRVINAAMESDLWLSAGREMTEETRQAFERNVEVTRPRGSLHIFVTATDVKPKVAEIMVKTMIQSYLDISKANDVLSDSARLEEAEGKEKLLASRIADHNERIAQASAEYGSPEGVAALEAAFLKRFTDASFLLIDVARELRLRGASLDALDREPSAVDETEGMSAVDLLKVAYRVQSDRKTMARQVVRQLGKIRAKIDLECGYRDALLDQHERLKMVISRLQSDLAGGGPFKVLSWGEMPSQPHDDPRMRRALAGAGIGAGAAFVLLLLLAFVRTRP